MRRYQLLVALVAVAILGGLSGLPQAAAAWVCGPSGCYQTGGYATGYGYAAPPVYAAPVTYGYSASDCSGGGGYSAAYGSYSSCSGGGGGYSTGYAVPVYQAPVYAAPYRPYARFGFGFGW